VGLRDVLFGRKQLKDAAGERLFAIATARITLETELDLRSTGAAGVCFKSLSAGEFVRAENELQQLLDAVAVESGSKISRQTDEFGFEWLVVHDGDFEDLVTTVHLVASELQSRGFGQQLLAAVFPFERRGFDGGRVYWIYGFKRGAFWPFVPKGDDGKERDNAEELELKAKLEQELPVEQDLSRWFAVFDAPV
jgi:PspA associated protein B